MSDSDSQEFKFQLTEAASMVIVHFSGEMTSKACPALKTCMNEISKRGAIKFVVFSFQKVTQVNNGDAVGLFAQLQKSIRARKAELRLCDLKDSFKEKLSRSGVLRNEEIRPSLKEAIVSFTPGRVTA